jgi:hypothetical protein
VEQSIVELVGSWVIELRDVQVVDWTVKVAPTKLRLEVCSSLTNDEMVTSCLSENGMWAGPIVLTPWTIDNIESKSVRVTVTGFASSTSSLGGFLSTITGTASALCVGRLPTVCGSFRVALYTMQQEVVQDNVFAYLVGTLELKEKK